MQRLISGAHAFSRYLAWFGGALLLACAFLVTFDVLTRKFFNYSIGGADELTGYAFCASTALAFSFALFERAHIRIDFVYRLMPQTLRSIADVLGLVLLIAFAALVVSTIYPLISDTIKYSSRSITPLRTPLIYPQAIWFFGWIFFVFSGLLLLVAALARLARGDWRASSHLIGIKSLQEQVADEAPDARMKAGERD